MQVLASAIQVLDKSMELAAQCLAKYQAVILESKLVHSTCFAEQSYSDSQ
jgi:hypothetical protein